MFLASEMNYTILKGLMKMLRLRPKEFTKSEIV